MKISRFIPAIILALLVCLAIYVFGDSTELSFSVSKYVAANSFQYNPLSDFTGKTDAAENVCIKIREQ